MAVQCSIVICTLHQRRLAASVHPTVDLIKPKDELAFSDILLA
jgi:hypothetical protein